jgi:hypothetical protein
MTQWPKEKVQKDKQRFTKHIYKTRDRITRTTLKTGDIGLLLTRKLLNQGFLLVKLKSSLVVNTSRSFPHSRLITEFITWLTRRVPLMEQELYTLPGHLSSPQWDSCYSIFRFMCMFCRSLFVPLYLLYFFSWKVKSCWNSQTNSYEFLIKYIWIDESK